MSTAGEVTDVADPEISFRTGAMNLVVENVFFHVAAIVGLFNRPFFGYDESVLDQTGIPVGLTSTHILERLVFSWNHDGVSTDVIDGFQYFNKEADNPTSEFKVNGDATGDIFDTDTIRVLGSVSNDGLYTVSGAPVFDGLFTDIIVVEVVPVTEMGGWVEKYTP